MGSALSVLADLAGQARLSSVVSDSVQYLAGQARSFSSEFKSVQYLAGKARSLSCGSDPTEQACSLVFDSSVALNPKTPFEMASRKLDPVDSNCSSVSLQLLGLNATNSPSSNLFLTALRLECSFFLSVLSIFLTGPGRVHPLFFIFIVIGVEDLIRFLVTLPDLACLGASRSGLSISLSEDAVVSPILPLNLLLFLMGRLFTPLVEGASVTSTGLVSPAKSLFSSPTSSALLDEATLVSACLISVLFGDLQQRS